MRLIPFAVLLLCLLFAGGAHAQAPVLTSPALTTPKTQAPGTVGTGGTFQTVLAANPARTDCVLQNTSTHTGYVYWLATGTPTLLNTMQIPPGGFFYCHAGNGQVARTAIQYTTSTTADPFMVAENQ